MARSLSLGAWLALRRGHEVEYRPPERPKLRRDEALVWMHCATPACADKVPALEEALATIGQRSRIVLTFEQDAPLDALPLPPEYRQPVRAFLDALRPDVLLWSGGPLRPMLLSEVRLRAILRVLIDARGPTLTLAEAGWIPGALGHLVRGFDHVLAVDHLTAQQIERLGADPARIEVTGPFEALASPPPCNEHERRDLADTIGPRPVWHAASLPLAELDDVITAHRHATRAMHRLLLIIAPAHEGDMEAMHDALLEAGLRVALRADGDDPEGPVEVYLAEGPGEEGLWYRLAPVTYLGGTLRGGEPDDPFAAAALGTAIIHGARTGQHEESFARLARAGAARSTRGGQALGHAVEALLAADRAATMAAAAWEVTTAGAVVANRIADLVGAARAERG